MQIPGSPISYFSPPSIERRLERELQVIPFVPSQTSQPLTRRAVVQLAPAEPLRRDAPPLRRFMGDLHTHRALAAYDAAQPGQTRISLRTFRGIDTYA